LCPHRFLATVTKGFFRSVIPKQHSPIPVNGNGGIPEGFHKAPEVYLCFPEKSSQGDLDGYIPPIFPKLLWKPFSLELSIGDVLITYERRTPSKFSR
jgi:hypothetical protein